MDFSDLAEPIDEEGCREGEYTVELRQLRSGVVFVGGSCDQRRVLDSIAAPKTLCRLGGALEVPELLEHQGDHLKSLATSFAVKIRQESGFIVAVWAPASRERDDDDLAAEERIGDRDLMAGEIREAEIESV